MSLRAFACPDGADAAPDTSAVAGNRALLWGLVLGLVLEEEIRHVGLNLALCVRGTPSVAAHTLVSHAVGDWPRQLVLLLLALATGMEEGRRRWQVTQAGLGVAALLLSANLGARGWYFLRRKPLRLGEGPAAFLAPVLSLAAATLHGLLFPYLGCAGIQAGGRAAVQLVMTRVVVVALLFVVSGMDAVQQLVVDSPGCNQDTIEIILGGWFALTSVACIFAAQRVAPPLHSGEGDDNRLLVETQTSPVGYRVPNFPDYPLDPGSYGSRGVSCGSLRKNTVVGVLVSLAVGVAVVMQGLYNYLGSANDYAMASASESASSELV